MDRRREFVSLSLSGAVSVAELSRRFGVSRQTGHRLLARYRLAGDAGLEDRSRRPLNSPSRSSAEVEGLVLDLRAAHPAWGGRKLARRLRDLGHRGVPAASTITAILRRHDLLGGASSPPPRATRRFARERANELWQMDFKGHFALDHGRCHALTVLDDHCRYSLGLRACADETGATVREQLTGLFRHYGLPDAMLADNGSPWGRHGGEFSALGVWLLRLGVALHHGKPYHPQTQGKDERFHRTLDVELLQMRRFRDLNHCQEGFDRWRQVYNHERPHEALALATPASRYQPSPRPFPDKLPAPQYYTTDLIRRVRHDGDVRFRGATLYLARAMAGLDVAFRPTQTDGVWDIYFARIRISQFKSQNA